MGWLIIVGLVAACITIMAVVIAAVHRAGQRGELDRSADGEAEGTGDRGRPRTRPLFILLAWASPGVAVVGVLVGLSIWSEPYDPQASRRDVAHRHKANDVWLLAASAVGVGLGVAGLCGIRSGRGAAVILPGSVLGIVLNLLLGLVALGHYALSGFEGPYV